MVYDMLIFGYNLIVRHGTNQQNLELPKIRLFSEVVDTNNSNLK